MEWRGAALLSAGGIENVCAGRDTGHQRRRGAGDPAVPANGDLRYQCSTANELTARAAQTLRRGLAVVVVNVTNGHDRTITISGIDARALYNQTGAAIDITFAGNVVMSITGPQLTCARLQTQRQTRIRHDWANPLFAFERGRGQLPRFRFNNYRSSFNWCFGITGKRAGSGW